MATIYVNSVWTDEAAFNADLTKPDGLTWGVDAFASYSAALEAAVDGDEIFVDGASLAPGELNVGKVDSDIDVTVNFINGVKVNVWNTNFRVDSGSTANVIGGSEVSYPSAPIRGTLNIGNAEGETGVVTGQNFNVYGEEGAETAQINVYAGSELIADPDVTANKSYVGHESNAERKGELNIIGGKVAASKTLEVNSTGKIVVEDGELAANTLNNKGTVNVSGDSFLNLANMTGNAVQIVADTTLTDSTVKGIVHVGFSQENEADTTLNLAGNTSIGTLYVGLEGRTNQYAAKIAGEDTEVTLDNLYNRTDSVVEVSGKATANIGYWQSKGSVLIDDATVNHTGWNMYVYNNDSADAAEIKLVNGAELNSDTTYAIYLGNSEGGPAKGNARLILESGSTLNTKNLILHAEGTVEEVADAKASTSVSVTDSTVNITGTLTNNGDFSVAGESTLNIANVVGNDIVASGVLKDSVLNMEKFDWETGNVMVDGELEVQNGTFSNVQFRADEGEKVTVSGKVVAAGATQFKAVNGEVVLDGEFTSDASEASSIEIEGADAKLTIGKDSKAKITGGFYLNGGTSTITGNLTEDTDLTLLTRADAQVDAAYSTWGGSYAADVTLTDTYVWNSMISTNNADTVVTVDNSLLVGWMSFDINGGKLVATNGSLVNHQAAEGWAKSSIGTDGALVVEKGSTFDAAKTVLTNNGTITVGADSFFTAKSIAGEGTITIDAADFAGGLKKIIDLSGTDSLEGKVELINAAEGVSVVYGADGDVMLTDTDTSTIYVNSAWSDKEFGADLGDGKIFGVNAFADANSAEGAAEGKAVKMVILEGTETVYDKDQWFFLNTNPNEGGENNAFDNVVDADKTYDMEVNGTFKAYQVLLNNAETTVSTTGKLLATGEALRVMGGSINVAGVREADAAAPAEIFTGRWGGGVSAGADTQVQGGYLMINQEAVASFADTVILVHAGHFSVDNAQADFSNTYIYLGDGGGYGKVNVSFSNGADVTFADNTTMIFDETYTVTPAMDITIDATSSLTVDADSTITASTLTVAEGGKLIIDAEGFTGVKKIIDLSGTDSLEGKVELLSAAENVKVIYGEDGDVTLTDADMSTLYVNTAYADLAYGTAIEGKEGLYAGINAFGDFDSAVAALTNDETTIALLSDATMTADPSFKLNVISGDGNDHTLQIDDVIDVDAEFAKEINLDAPLFMAYYNNHNVIVNGDLKGGFYNYTGSMTFNNSKITNSYDNSNIGGVVTINGDGNWTVENPQADNLKFINVGRSDWLGQGILNLNDTVIKAIEYNVDSSSADAKSQINAVNSTVATVLNDGAWGNLNVGANGELNLTDSDLNVVGTLTNNGAVNVTGESTINAATMTGNYIRFEDATLVGDNAVGGNIRTYGDFTLDGTLTVKQSNFYGTTVFKDGVEFTGSTTIVGVGAEFTLEDGASINSRFFNVMGIADIEGEITLLHSDPRQKLLQLFDGGIVNINEGAVITIDGHNAVINAGGTLNIDGGTLNITKWAQYANDETRGGVLYNDGAVVITADGLLTGSIISGEGTVTIDAADFTSTRKVLDLNAAESSEGKVTIENLAEGVRAIYAADGDIVLTDAKVDALHVDAAFEGDFGDDLGDGKYFGINAFNSLSEAMANATSETAEIRVYSDITEAISGGNFSGKIVKGGENDVVITDSANNDYVNLSDFNLGEGVTIDAKYFYLDGENELDGDVKSSSTFYSSGKTTITGNAEVYTAMSRYYASADAGIYVVGTAEAGEGKNAEVQFKANNYLGHYSGTFSVKDTAAAFGYILLNGDTDGEGYSQAQLVLDNAKVSTIGGPNTQPGQVLMNGDSEIVATNDSVLDFRGPNDYAYLSMGADNTITLTDSIMYLGKDGQGTNAVNGTITLNSSTLDALGSINLGGTIALDSSSFVTATKITGTGTFTIDATDFTGTRKVIDLSGTESLAGRVTVTGEGVTALYGADGDVTITNVDTTTVYYNNAWADAADYTEVEAGKVVGFNAFAKFDWSGTNDKGWSNLLVLPADTEKLVLTAGNDDASYGMLRPTQNVTVETEGEGYAVIDRVVNMGADLVIAEDAKVKVLCVGGLSGANNQGGQFIINGELYFANANSSDKAIYLWGMNSTPGDMLINAGGLLKADAGNIENHGLITVLGTMELGSAGDAPKLAGVGASNGGWQGQLVVDGAEGEGVVIVKHNQLNFGGGNTWQAWEDAPAGCEVTIENGGKIETAAVTFRNGKNNTLTVDGGSLIFNDGSAYSVDYSNATATYFDNKGEILVANGGSVDMSGRTFTNDGDITLKDTASFAADSIINNSTIVLDSFAGSIKGANTLNGAIIAQGESVLNDDIATNGLYVGFKAGADDAREVDTLTVNKNVELNNLYVRGTGLLNVAEGATIDLESAVDGIFASYGTTNISGTLNVANTLSDGNNLIGNTSYANESAVVNVNEGGVFSISSRDGVTGTSLKIDSDGALNILGGEFNADNKTTIDAAGDITVESGAFTAEGTVNLTANFAIGGFTAGETREITVAFTPDGEINGFTKTYTLGANATELKVSASDIADGVYKLTVIDGLKAFEVENFTVSNGTFSVDSGKVTLDSINLGKGSFDVYGESSINIEEVTGTAIYGHDATLVDSTIGGTYRIYGTENEITGTSKITGITGVGWGDSYASEQVALNITGDFYGTNVLVGSTSAFDHQLYIGEADADRTTAYFAQLGGFGDIAITNADVSYAYTFIRNNLDVTDATFTATSVNTYVSGNAVVVFDNAQWDTTKGQLDIGSYGADYMRGNADVSIKNGSVVNASTIRLENTDDTDYAVKFAVVDSTVNAKKVLALTGSEFTVSGNSTLVISDFQGVLSVADDTVFGADTAITITNGSVNAEGAVVTMKQGAITGAANFTADKLILTDVLLPTDQAITIYAGATDIDELVINGSNVVDGTAVINGVKYDVVTGESGITMNVSDSAYVPVSFDITGIEQSVGGYNFTVSVDVTGGVGEYSYQITDVDGNVIANGLEFTLDDPTARMLKLTLSVTDAYGETTSVATKNIFVQVVDYTAPVIGEITASTTAETTGKVVLTADITDNFDAAVADNLTVTYSTDGGKTWNAYNGKVNVFTNCTVTFKAEDATGNVTTKEFVVDNIVSQQDYDRNGLADTLFVHDNKLTSAWFSVASDSEITLTDLAVMDDNMALLGSGRIYGSANDGSDIFYTDGTTVKAWDVQNGVISGEAKDIWKIDANREILGIGDFNGDGASDVLIKSGYGDVGAIFANADGSTTWNYFSSLGDEWKLSAIGDFNGDGLDDVVLHHTEAGFAGAWLTQEDGSVKWSNLDNIEGGEVIGAGDFNGDDIDDVLIRKGEWVGAWITDENGNATKTVGFGNITATVEQIADFNGDGIDDIRVRDDNMIGVITVGADGSTQWKEFIGVGDEWKSSTSGLIC